MKLDEKKLIDWCWSNLRFDNCPDSWEDTYIIDIINGYNGSCFNHEGNVIYYSDIRNMFEIKEDE